MADIAEGENVEEMEAVAGPSQKELEAELVVSAGSGNFAEVRKAIEESLLDVNSIDKEGSSVIAAAAYGAFELDVPLKEIVDMILYLLDKGADLTVVNKWQWTPLISAAFSSKDEPLPLIILLGYLAPDVSERRGGHKPGQDPADVLPLEDVDGVNFAEHVVRGYHEAVTAVQYGYVSIDQMIAHDDAACEALAEGRAWTDQDTQQFVDNTADKFHFDGTIDARLNKANASCEILAAALGLTPEQLQADPKGAVNRPLKPVKEWIHYVANAARPALIERAGLTGVVHASAFAAAAAGAGSTAAPPSAGGAAEEGEGAGVPPVFDGAASILRQSMAGGRASMIGGGLPALDGREALMRRQSSAKKIPRSVAKRMTMNMARRATGMWGEGGGEGEGGLGMSRVGRDSMMRTSMAAPPASPGRADSSGTKTAAPAAAAAVQASPKAGSARSAGAGGAGVGLGKEAPALSPRDLAQGSPAVPARVSAGGDLDAVPRRLFEEPSANASAGGAGAGAEAGGVRQRKSTGQAEAGAGSGSARGRTPPRMRPVAVSYAPRTAAELQADYVRLLVPAVYLLLMAAVWGFNWTW